ncbi:hypothetical protein TYRP_006453 [Tyrophagus putrescentiae]|nr:hypothetical protein TYRP_006453 [Tyrophagus putrescentiae]
MTRAARSRSGLVSSVNIAAQLETKTAWPPQARAPFSPVIESSKTTTADMSAGGVAKRRAATR